jgi:hypothetical protein
MIRALQSLKLAPMSYKSYAENFVQSYNWDRLCDEMYWLDEYSDDLCMLVMEKCALSDGVVLILKDGFDDYEDFFWESYKNTEKGLS